LKGFCFLQGQILEKLKKNFNFLSVSKTPLLSRPEMGQRDVTMRSGVLAHITQA
jgi:hypothetical protein